MNLLAGSLKQKRIKQDPKGIMEGCSFCLQDVGVANEMVFTLVVNPKKVVLGVVVLGASHGQNVSCMRPAKCLSCLYGAVPC